jgi:hypothetical protein
MIPGILGLPTMEGNMALGASSPEIPALHIPEPLSITTAAVSNDSVIEDLNEVSLDFYLIFLLFSD